MIWLNSIDELQFYSPNQVGDCYCELITEPSDMILQAPIDHAPITYINGEVYTFSAIVLTPDGLTILEDASASFQWYIVVGGGGFFANIRLTRVTEIMCSNVCFILHVVINRVQSFPNGTSIDIEVFNGYTERYCVDNCCILPSNITITQDVPPSGESDYLGADYEPTEYLTDES